MTKIEAAAQGTIETPQGPVKWLEPGVMRNGMSGQVVHMDRCKTCGATWHCADKHVSKVGDVVKHRRVAADEVVEVSKFACPTCMRAGRVDAFEGF